MDEKRMRKSGGPLMARAVAELEKCNEVTAKYGLTLSNEQIQTLVEKRFEALRDTGRVEFGQGVLPKLAAEFCDSPYIWQDNYLDTLLELQDIFYHFKNDSLDILSDDELIRLMKDGFDHASEGSLEYLRETTLEELGRDLRSGGYAGLFGPEGWR